MEKKSPRSFVDGGVGLGIVAAMTDSSDRRHRARDWTKFSHPAVSLRSSPIQIVSLARPAAANFNCAVGLSRHPLEKEDSDEDGGSDSVVDENDEVYTCVISHVGNDVVKKFVYYGDKVSGLRDDAVTVFDVNPVAAAAAGMFYASSSPLMMTAGFGGAAEGWRNDFCNQDFLASCFLCKKLLHGLDIFMYRGEKAFCSPECREKHIRDEDYREKNHRYGEIRKRPHECSLSPCSSPQVYLAEVAAA
ncbi:unnamed protein product [Linum tenue]|uniref:FLZ-type domain-containing protein n=1 Tax=Linum tenue TaxID=586396 RepID=A0AAV0HU30_9ROSI|nr:unnamed protein product [Linum tenue]